MAPVQQPRPRGPPLKRVRHPRAGACLPPRLLSHQPAERGPSSLHTYRPPSQYRVRGVQGTGSHSLYTYWWDFRPLPCARGSLLQRGEQKEAVSDDRTAVARRPRARGGSPRRRMGECGSSRLPQLSQRQGFRFHLRCWRGMRRDSGDGGRWARRPRRQP